jgi:hypothetical protein
MWQQKFPHQAFRRRQRWLLLLLMIVILIFLVASIGSKTMSTIMIRSMSFFSRADQQSEKQAGD